MNKGTLVISLDTELAWGRIAEEENRNYYPLHHKTKDVIKRLVSLFDKYNCPATWAIVGRLIDDEHEKNDSDLGDFYHGLSNQAVYSNPELNQPSRSIILFPGLMKLLADAEVDHEIASHSYNHILFGRLRQDQKDKAVADIRQAEKVFSRYGEKPISIVFPRNLVGCHKAFTDNGYKIFRGTEKNWFSGYPRLVEKAARQIDTLFAMTPPVCEPIVEDGWVNLPGSMVFRARSIGIKKNIPLSIYIAKAKKGIDKAIREGKVLHLYLHPFNFAFKEKEHFAALSEVLAYANEGRKDDKLDILTMKDTVQKYNLL